MARELIALDRGTSSAWHAAHFNPMLAEVLPLLGYGRDFVRGQGTRLWDAPGVEYIDLARLREVTRGHPPAGVASSIFQALRHPARNKLDSFLGMYS